MRPPRPLALRVAVADPDAPAECAEACRTRAVDRAVRGAWQMGLGSDLALPEVEGTRPLGVRLLDASTGRLLAASTTATAGAVRQVSP